MEQGGEVESIGNSTVVGSMTEQRLRSRASWKQLLPRTASPAGNEERGSKYRQLFSIEKFSPIELRGNDNDQTSVKNKNETVYRTFFELDLARVGKILA